VASNVIRPAGTSVENCLNTIPFTRFDVDKSKISKITSISSISFTCIPLLSAQKSVLVQHDVYGTAD
jgi:hypothetical protein